MRQRQLMLDDLRYSIRLLRRSPALTIASVCTILAAVAGLFVLVSTGAILLPVWRAVRVDPVRALRQQ